MPSRRTHDVTAHTLACLAILAPAILIASPVRALTGVDTSAADPSLGVPPDSTIEAYARGFDVSRIDSTQSPGRFDAWLRRIVGDEAEITWEVNDCGETGTADVFCVEAFCRLPTGGTIDLSLIAGNGELGITGVPKVWWGEIAGLGPSVNVVHLGELAEQLKEARSLAEQMGRAPSRPLDDATAIAYVKHISARALSGRLPDITVGSWVDSLAAGVSPVGWKVDGWHRTRASLRPGEDIWASVVATFEDSRVSVGLEIRVGTFRKGIWGSPKAEAFVYNKRRHSAGHVEIGDLAHVLEEILR